MAEPEMVSVPVELLKRVRDGYYGEWQNEDDDIEELQEYIPKPKPKWVMVKDEQSIEFFANPQKWFDVQPDAFDVIHKAVKARLGDDDADTITKWIAEAFEDGADK